MSNSLHGGYLKLNRSELVDKIAKRFLFHILSTLRLIHRLLCIPLIIQARLVDVLSK